MRGEVVRLETPLERGLILGTDGKRYEFNATQVRNSAVLSIGSAVDFVAMGDVARDIYQVTVAPVAPATPASVSAAAAPIPVPGMAPPQGMGAQQTVLSPHAPYAGELEVPADGLWTYFIRGLTKNYVQFNGRARRSEYWGYTLFWWIFVVGFVVLDVILSAMLSAATGTELILPIFTILWQLGTLLPNVAIVVRRIHDNGLSGWLYALKILDLILPIGSLIIFVLTLMDSQRMVNVHGPSPKWSVDGGVVGTFD